MRAVPSEWIVTIAVERTKRNGVGLRRVENQVTGSRGRVHSRNEQRQASEKDGDIFYKLAHDAISSMGLSFVGVHPRSCQANSPEHSDLTEQRSQSLA